MKKNTYTTKKITKDFSQERNIDILYHWLLTKPNFNRNSLGNLLGVAQPTLRKMFKEIEKDSSGRHEALRRFLTIEMFESLCIEYTKEHEGEISEITKLSRTGKRLKTPEEQANEAFKSMNMARELSGMQALTREEFDKLFDNATDDKKRKG